MKQRTRSTAIGNYRDWSEFIKSFCHNRVRFVVIGAHALAVLGRPRHTGDLDVFVDATKANLDRVAAALRDFGFDSLAEEAPAALAVPGSLLVLGREPVQINVTNTISGVTFQEAWRSRNTKRIADCDVAFLGRRTLIKNKKAAAKDPTRGGKKFIDLADVAALEKMDDSE